MSEPSLPRAAERGAKPSFARFCEAAGGYGEALSEPYAAPEAIRRCLAEVRGGRPAVLHVKIPVL